MVFNNTYGITEKNYWCLCQICNDAKILVKSNNDIVDDNIIKKICDNNQIWSLGKVKKGGYILVSGTFSFNQHSSEQLSTIESLKRYGVEWMEDAIERAYGYIPLEFERERKLKELLKND